MKTYRGIFERHTIRGTMETFRFQRSNEMDRGVYCFVCFLLASVVRCVEVNRRDRCLDAGLRGPGHGNVDVPHGSARQRLAPLDELRVRRICHKSSHMCARLPNFGGEELVVSRQTRGRYLVNSRRIQYVLLGFPSTVPQYWPFMPLSLPGDYQGFVKLARK